MLLLLQWSIHSNCCVNCTINSSTVTHVDCCQFGAVMYNAACENLVQVNMIYQYGF